MIFEEKINKVILKLCSSMHYNNYNGITLVSLVITVILMLILAGVAISTIVDSDGLLGKIRNVSTMYEEQSQVENNVITTLMENFVNGNEVKFPISESGKYQMTVNAGKTAMWLGVDLKEVNIPEGANIIIKYITSDDLKNWDEEKEDIFLVRNSQYLRVIIELIPNESGEVPTISSAKVRFKTDVENFVTTELENMIQQENGWVVLKEELTVGETGKVTQIKELTEEDKEKGLGLCICENLSSTTDSEEGSENTYNNMNTGIVSDTGIGTGYNTKYYKSSDGQNWLEINSLSPIEVVDASYVKAVTIVEKAEENEVMVGPLVSKVEGVSGTIEKQWIDSKTEYYEFDAIDIGNWIELVKDETIYDGTRIKYYFTKSNDNTNWTEYNEDITAKGGSRYLKLKIVYQKERYDVKEDAILNDFYINYNVADDENEGQYINKNLNKYEKNLYIDFVNDEVEYNVIEGGVSNDLNYGLYPTSYGTGSGWQSATIQKDYNKPIYLPLKFEISSKIRYWPSSVKGMAGAKISFQKKQEDGMYIEIFYISLSDAWDSSAYNSFGYYYKDTSIYALNRTTGHFNTDRRYAITGNDTNFVAYMAGTQRGTLARTDLSQISFDRIEIKLQRYYGYTAQKMYVRDIYIGELKYIT